MLPTFFLAHGSPMNAIQDTEFSRGWTELGKKLLSSKYEFPRAILVVSAHWVTEGTYITSANPMKTIHDFGGFPQELFDVQYPAPGSPEIADQVIEKVFFTPIKADFDWGMDHGTWSILKWIFPDANIPVLQISIDGTKPFLWHYEMGQHLSKFRNENILLIGSGNLVHNLGLLNWKNWDEQLDWAVESNQTFKTLIQERDFRKMASAHNISPAAKLAINSAEHYVPALYSMGFGHEEKHLEFFHDKVQSSISMLSFQLGE
jgi:4,5-DOPA dioxygenase extradiol